MKFSEVIEHLKEGKRVRRKSWQHNSSVYIKDNMFVWTLTGYQIRSIKLEAEDLFAEDWEVVEEGL